MGDSELYQAFLEGIKWNIPNDTTAGNGFLYSFRVSCFFTEITRQIHSLRASDVRTSHAARALGAEASAFRRSAGTL